MSSPRSSADVFVVDDDPFQRDIVTELTHAVLLGAPTTLEPMFAAWFAEADSDAGRLRVVVDQVASLTDTAALNLYGRLRGR